MTERSFVRMLSYPAHTTLTTERLLFGHSVKRTGNTRKVAALDLTILAQTKGGAVEASDNNKNNQHHLKPMP